MQQLARVIGFIYMLGGSILLFSPGTARQMVRIRAGAFRSLTDWTSEFAQLSSGALRLLGGSIFLVGAMLVLVTTKRQ